jgi:hypothetical protein
MEASSARIFTNARQACRGPSASQRGSAASKLEGGTIGQIPSRRVKVSCDVADAVSLVGREGQTEGPNSKRISEQTVASSVEREGRTKRESDGKTQVVYPAKAAPGLCARLARCGGRGFLKRGCRLVVYLFIILIHFLFINLNFNSL